MAGTVGGICQWCADPDIQLNRLKCGKDVSLGLRHRLVVDNNPFSSNQDYDKCFNHESPDRNRAFYKENCLFTSPSFFLNLYKWQKQFRGRQVIIWKTAVFIAPACSHVCLLPATEWEPCPGWGWGWDEGRVVVTLASNRNSFSSAMEANQIRYMGFFWGMWGVELKEIDRVKTLFQADKSDIAAPTQGWIKSHSTRSPGAAHLLFSKHKKHTFGLDV